MTDAMQSRMLEKVKARRRRQARLERGLAQRSRYPSRVMIVSHGGKVYWPQPGECALDREVMLPPFRDGVEWTANDIDRAIARRGQ